jgi:hypothetical protein
MGMNVRYRLDDVLQKVIYKRLRTVGILSLNYLAQSTQSARRRKEQMTYVWAGKEEH